jgi:hypothetical protein
MYHPVPFSMATLSEPSRPYGPEAGRTWHGIRE